MLQWNLYVPAAAGAVNVALDPPLTVTLNAPSSAVTVWLTASLLCTDTALPALTGDGLKVKFRIVMPAWVDELLGLLEHAARPTARSPVAMRAIMRRCMPRIRKRDRVVQRSPDSALTQHLQSVLNRFSGWPVLVSGTCVDE
jgi:hypothetical protein